MVLKWSSLDDIADENANVDVGSTDDQQTNDSEPNAASSSFLDNPINDIQFAQ